MMGTWQQSWKRLDWRQHIDEILWKICQLIYLNCSHISSLIRNWWDINTITDILLLMNHFYLVEISSEYFSIYNMWSSLQVLYDFEQAHKLASGKLFKNWPQISENLSNVMRLHKMDTDFVTMWSKDVEKFLMLLKLLPATAKGPETLASGIETFNRAVDKLIIFKEVRSILHYVFTYLVIILFTIQ